MKQDFGPSCSLFAEKTTLKSIVREQTGQGVLAHFAIFAVKNFETKDAKKPAKGAK
jgi:hypothetical protein